jgi:cyclic dehypoxanthinyl futalosine synthase
METMGITRQQALDCFASDDLIGIGMEADAIRRTLHPEAVVTYTIDRPLDCSTPDFDSLYASALTSVDLGAIGLRILSDPAISSDLDHYEALFAGIKQRFPEVRLHGLSATEILTLSTSSSLTLGDTIQRLRASGLDSLASSAVILDDDVRHRITPHKCTTAEWLEVHRTAHLLGMTTAATMIFGVGETMEQRVHHLELIRDLQHETAGFTDFTPLVFERENPLEEPTAVEYLKTLAISRLFLDNIANVQASWRTQSLKVLQMGLRFGGNDVGSVLLEDHNTKPGGATEEELRRVIRDAGFKPVQRDILYRTVYLN